MYVFDIKNKEIRAWTHLKWKMICYTTFLRRQIYSESAFVPAFDFFRNHHFFTVSNYNTMAGHSSVASLSLHIFIAITSKHTHRKWLSPMFQQDHHKGAFRRPLTYKQPHFNRAPNHFAWRVHKNFTAKKIICAHSPRDPTLVSYGVEMISAINAISGITVLGARMQLLSLSNVNNKCCARTAGATSTGTTSAAPAAVAVTATSWQKCWRRLFMAIDERAR